MRKNCGKTSSEVNTDSWGTYLGTTVIWLALMGKIERSTRTKAKKEVLEINGCRNGFENVEKAMSRMTS